MQDADGAGARADDRRARHDLDLARMRLAGQLMRARAITASGLVACALGAAAGVARADDMAGMAMAESSGDRSAYGAGVALVAASYDTTYYLGSYEGVVPSASWSRGAWSAMAMVGIYHVLENGLDVYGVGDAMASGSLTLVDAGELRAGLTFAASAPTGSMDKGLGMGNAMVMPSAWATRRFGRLAIAASAGYTRALGDLDGQEHGLWPIVEPMNMQELAWRAAASVQIRPRLALGAYASGGVPIAVPMGAEHAIAALRAVWTGPRLVTAAELQAGVAGDPVSVRGVVETSVTF
jgi:hypothetical protein